MTERSSVSSESNQPHPPTWARAGVSSSYAMSPTRAPSVASTAAYSSPEGGSRGPSAHTVKGTEVRLSTVPAQVAAHGSSASPARASMNHLRRSDVSPNENNRPLTTSFRNTTYGAQRRGDLAKTSTLCPHQLAAITLREDSMRAEAPPATDGCQLGPSLCPYKHLPEVAIDQLRSSIVPDPMAVTKWFWRENASRLGDDPCGWRPFSPDLEAWIEAEYQARVAKDSANARQAANTRRLKLFLAEDTTAPVDGKGERRYVPLVAGTARDGSTDVQRLRTDAFGRRSAKDPGATGFTAHAVLPEECGLPSVCSDDGRPGLSSTSSPMMANIISPSYDCVYRGICYDFHRMYMFTSRNHGARRPIRRVTFSNVPRWLLVPEFSTSILVNPSPQQECWGCDVAASATLEFYFTSGKRSAFVMEINGRQANVDLDTMKAIFIPKIVRSMETDEAGLWDEEGGLSVRSDKQYPTAAEGIEIDDFEAEGVEDSQRYLAASRRRQQGFSLRSAPPADPSKPFSVPIALRESMSLVRQPITITEGLHASDLYDCPTLSQTMSFMTSTGDVLHATTSDRASFTPDPSPLSAVTNPSVVGWLEETFRDALSGGRLVRAVLGSGDFSTTPSAINCPTGPMQSCPMPSSAECTQTNYGASHLWRYSHRCPYGNRPSCYLCNNAEDEERSLITYCGNQHAASSLLVTHQQTSLNSEAALLGVLSAHSTVRRCYRRALLHQLLFTHTGADQGSPAPPNSKGMTALQIAEVEWRRNQHVAKKALGYWEGTASAALAYRHKMTSSKQSTAPNTPTTTSLPMADPFALISITPVTNVVLRNVHIGSEEGQWVMSHFGTNQDPIATQGRSIQIQRIQSSILYDRYLRGRNEAFKDAYTHVSSLQGGAAEDRQGDDGLSALLEMKESVSFAMCPKHLLSDVLEGTISKIEFCSSAGLVLNASDAAFAVAEAIEDEARKVSKSAAGEIPKPPATAHAEALTVNGWVFKNNHSTPLMSLAMVAAAGGADLASDGIPLLTKGSGTKTGQPQDKGSDSVSLGIAGLVPTQGSVPHHNPASPNSSMRRLDSSSILRGPNRSGGSFRKGASFTGSSPSTPHRRTSAAVASAALNEALKGDLKTRTDSVAFAQPATLLLGKQAARRRESEATSVVPLPPTEPKEQPASSMAKGRRRKHRSHPPTPPPPAFESPPAVAKARVAKIRTTMLLVGITFDGLSLDITQVATRCQGGSASALNEARQVMSWPTPPLYRHPASKFQLTPSSTSASPPVSGGPRQPSSLGRAPSFVGASPPGSGPGPRLGHRLSSGGRQHSVVFDADPLHRRQSAAGLGGLRSPSLVISTSDGLQKSSNSPLKQNSHRSQSVLSSASSAVSSKPVPFSGYDPSAEGHAPQYSTTSITVGLGSVPDASARPQAKICTHYNAHSWYPMYLVMLTGPADGEGALE